MPPSSIERELTRLERLPPASPDHQVIRTYLELVIELPWKKATTDIIDLEKTRAILDEDHYGLDEVKERILEDLDSDQAAFLRQIESIEL